MPRTCTICAHPDRAAIDEALVAGKSYRDIARRFETSPAAIHRHRSGHIAATVTRAHDAEEVARGDDLLAQIRNLHTRTLAVLDQAESTGDARTVLLAVREARTNLELLARLLGDLREAQTVNVLVQPEWYRVHLITDSTGVGAPVVDLLCQAGLNPVAVTITGGDAAKQEAHNHWRVPKRDLVSVLQVLLQSGRLKIAETLPEAPRLVQELLAFRVRITATAHDTYGAWREGAHDDLVLAVALACWFGEKGNKRFGRDFGIL